jgi:hypothetical protein
VGADNEVAVGGVSVGVKGACKGEEFVGIGFYEFDAEIFGYCRVVDWQYLERLT